MLTASMALPARAQLPYPKLDSIFPPGGQAGTVVNVTVAGTDLDFSHHMVFSHPGLKSSPRHTATGAWHDLQTPIPNQFQVTIGASVPEGIYEARLLGPWGLSTSRAFVVDHLDEVRENNTNHEPARAMAVRPALVVNGHAGAATLDYFRLPLNAGDEVLVEMWAERIDSRLDGTLELFDPRGHRLRTSRDYQGRDPQIVLKAPVAGAYLIKAYDTTYRGGQDWFYRLAIRQTAQIEAVFPPMITAGSKSPLQLLGWQLPDSVPSSLRAIDGHLFQQREVKISAPTWSTRANTRANTRATRNPADRPPLTSVGPRAADQTEDGFVVANAFADPSANAVVVGLTDLPVVAEQEPNNTFHQAQHVPIPAEVAGRFYSQQEDAGHQDRDWFQFEARQRDDLHLEVLSFRLGHNVDPLLLVTRVAGTDSAAAPGKLVRHADDGAKLPGGWGLDRISLDPVTRLQVTEAGSYRICVVDQQSGQVDPRNAYRLVIRPPRPNFRVLASTPSPWNANPEQPLRWPGVLRRGGTMAIEVWIVRQEGWTGPVEVVARGLPAGVTAAPLRIPAGSHSGTMVLQAAEQAAAVCQPIRIEATGRRGDTTLIRLAQPVAFEWDTAKPRGLTQVRATADLVVCAAPDPAPLSVSPLPLASAADLSYQIAQGKTIDIPLRITQRVPLKSKLEFAPPKLPAGIVSSFEVDAEAPSKDPAQGNKVSSGSAAAPQPKILQGRWRLTVAADCPVAEYSLLLAGKPKVTYRRLPAQAAQAAQREQHLAHLVKQLTAARQQAEQRAREGATEKLLASEQDALKKAAEQAAQHEQAAQQVRDAAAAQAKKLAAAAKPTDRLAYVVSPSIHLTVTPPATESSKQPITKQTAGSQ